MHPSIPHLRTQKVFAPLIRKHGEPKLRRGKNAFQALARAIIYQQISTAAATSVYRKFVGLYGIRVEAPIDWESAKGWRFPTPAQILATRTPRLRSAGLSAQKVLYVRDLAHKFADGTVPYRRFTRMTNKEVIGALTQVKGIGEWTAHMFLIFTLNRPDILPVGDLGIRKGFQQVYGLKSLPSPRTMERLAAPWRAHASAASWYLWRVADTATAPRTRRANGG